MLISVSAEDIATAKKSFDVCPLTAALRRYFGPHISVSRDYIRAINKKKTAWTLIELPKAAKTFTLNYDANYPLGPFSFNLSAKNVKLLKQKGK